MMGAVRWAYLVHPVWVGCGFLGSVIRTRDNNAHSHIINRKR